MEKHGDSSSTAVSNNSRVGRRFARGFCILRLLVGAWDAPNDLALTERVPDRTLRTVLPPTAVSLAPAPCVSVSYLGENTRSQPWLNELSLCCSTHTTSSFSWISGAQEQALAHYMHSHISPHFSPFVLWFFSAKRTSPPPSGQVKEYKRFQRRPT